MTMLYSMGRVNGEMNFSCYWYESFSYLDEWMKSMLLSFLLWSRLGIEEALDKSTFAWQVKLFSIVRFTLTYGRLLMYVNREVKPKGNKSIAMICSRWQCMTSSQSGGPHRFHVNASICLEQLHVKSVKSHSSSFCGPSGKHLGRMRCGKGTMRISISVRDAKTMRLTDSLTTYNGDRKIKWKNKWRPEPGNEKSYGIRDESGRVWRWNFSHISTKIIVNVRFRCCCHRAWVEFRVVGLSVCGKWQEY